MRSPLAPRFRLYIGSNGKTIPNPIRSMKTVRKMTRTEGFLMNNKQPLTRRLQAESATTSAKSICGRLPVKREGKHPAPTKAADYAAQSAKAAAQLCDHTCPCLNSGPLSIQLPSHVARCVEHTQNFQGFGGRIIKRCAGPKRGCFSKAQEVK